MFFRSKNDIASMDMRLSHKFRRKAGFTARRAYTRNYNKRNDHLPTMGQLKVSDIMTTQVISLLGTDTLKDATITLAVDNLSGAPVVDEENRLIGILSECDILKVIMDHEANLENPVLHLLAFPMDAKIDDPQLKAAADKISQIKVADLMIPDVITTSPNAEIIDVLRLMIDKDVNRVPVLEKGVLVGIVTRGDIIFSIYKRKI